MNLIGDIHILPAKTNVPDDVRISPSMCPMALEVFRVEICHLRRGELRAYHILSRNI